MARKTRSKPVRREPPDRRNVWIPLALAALVLLIYARTAGHPFINFDDNAYIYENAHVIRGLSLENIGYAFTDTSVQNWVPLTLLSHMVDVQVFGLNAGMHHLMSALFHLLNSVLVFFVLRRLTGAVWRSAAVAALFAVHPMRIESVAWAAERKDVLCALFWLLTMWSWISYLEQKSLRRYALVLALFACALMSKPMAVTLPLALILVEYWPLRKPFALRDKLPLLAMSLAASIVTIVAQRHTGATEVLDAIPLPVRVANAIVAYAEYIGRTFWPLQLSLIYPYRRILLAWEIVLAAAMLVAITWAVVRWRQQAPWAGAGWAWFVVTLLPTIGLLQVGYQANADRYSYLPCIGLLLIVVWAAAEFAPKSWFKPGAAIAVGGLALISFVQLSNWQDPVTLFSHVLSVTKDNYVAQTLLGQALVERDRIDEAVPHLTEAIRIRPDYPWAHNDLGNILGRQGKYAEALHHFDVIIAKWPDSALARYNRALQLVEANRLDEALAEFKRALDLNLPLEQRYIAATRAGIILGNRGDPHNAETFFLTAVGSKPASSEAHKNLAGALWNGGKWNDAIDQMRQAAHLNPGDTDAANKLRVMTTAQGK